MALGERVPGRRWRLLLVFAATLGLCAFTALPAAATDDERRVKYYIVTDQYLGEPENLYEIAERFLGSAARFTEVLDRNLGRPQPDGGAVSDPAKLTPGWVLILPWDAMGRELQLGVPPTAAPSTPRASSPPRTGSPASSAPRASASPSATSVGGSGDCRVPAAKGSQSDWAARRLAAARVWSQTQGHGEVVAVVDSGVDASLPELTGRVADGADIVTGSGSGTTDCVGTGTAMASLIGAKPSQDGAFIGVAPEATLIPVRVAAGPREPSTPDQATAIDVAVSAGATVIALGGFVDATDADVSRAIADAVKHDVVVVAGAPVRGGDSDQRVAGPPQPAVLRVGGIDDDRRLAMPYRDGGVDVVAPGVDVTYLGVAGTGKRTGTGTQYAVALVAGQVALVRAAHPELDAVAVVQRIRDTTDPLAGRSPDPAFGWGMINLVASVTSATADDRGGKAAGQEPDGGNTTLLVIVVGVVVAVAVVLLTLRIRRMARAAAGKDDPTQTADAPMWAPAPTDPYRDRA